MDRRHRAIHLAVKHHAEANNLTVTKVLINGHFRISFALPNGKTDSITIPSTPRANDGLPNFVRQNIHRMLRRNGL